VSLVPIAWLALLFAPSCARPVEPAKAADRPNFVVIDIDSLRADRVDAQRTGTYVAPQIHRLAEEGVSFSTMISQSGWTLPALRSILQSRSPVLMELGDGGLSWSEEGVRSLPEILSYYGYFNVAFWGGTVAGAYPPVSIGFQHTQRFQGSGQTIERTVSSWIESRPPEPFFAFVHDIDLHQMIPTPPMAWLHRFTSDPGDCLPLPPHLLAPHLAPRIGEEQAHAHAIAHYDGSLAWYDAIIGRIRTALDQSRFSDHTVIVVTSNHGEDLYDNLGIGHGALYETVVRVPLVIDDPRTSPRIHRVPTQVSTLDFTPTILELASIPPDITMEGQSLVPLFSGKAGSYEERDVFSLSKRSVASLRTPHAKLLTHDAQQDYEGAAKAGDRGDEAPVVELYDLDTDPGEHHDLAAERPGQRAEMEARLHAWLEGRDTGKPQPISEEFRKELQTRGYWGMVEGPRAGP
jgi:arylsulfatase A-like enzyme